MVEAKRPLKAQLQAELAAAGSSEAQDEIRAAFAAREKAVEHDIGESHLPTLRQASPLRRPCLTPACSQTTSRSTCT
jgi:hypothetical protein